MASSGQMVEQHEWQRAKRDTTFLGSSVFSYIPWLHLTGSHDIII